MTNLQTLALSKAISDKLAKAARGGVTVGDHEVDITVHVRGTLSVFADTSKVPTVSIPMKETLALFIRYSGITGPHAMNLLKRAMTDALAANEEGEQNTAGTGAIAEAMPIINDTIDNIVNPMLATLPKTPVKGMVKPNLQITEVGALVEA